MRNYLPEITPEILSGCCHTLPLGTLYISARHHLHPLNSASTSGNRLNSEGTAAFYCADNEDTLKAEVSNLKSRPIVSIDAGGINALNVLELSTKCSGIDQCFSQTGTANYSDAQALGTLLKSHGYSALLVPSVAAKNQGFSGMNLVLFTPTASGIPMERLSTYQLTGIYIDQ